MNTKFREAVYRWSPGKWSSNGGEDLQRIQKVQHMKELQRIFAYLQLSKKRVVDPSDFAKLLLINQAIQQDAQVRPVPLGCS